MKAYLHLETGEVFTGEHFGAPVDRSGELVFSTGMTGYVESLTDPSFAGEMLVFTYPLIGNYGVPRRRYQAKHVAQNWESDQVWVQGVVVSEACGAPSHSQSDLTLNDWLTQQNIPGISGLDTRLLAHLIRDRGTVRAQLSTAKKTPAWDSPLTQYPVPLASCTTVQHLEPTDKFCGKTLLLIDCGVKHGILRCLLAKGYRVIRVPYDSDVTQLTSDFDGVVVSNGPGDPKWCGTAIGSIRFLLDRGIPYLGICLGHQLLALALGADTHKLPFGHRGLNQPCLNRLTNRAYLTSQNHGYVVDRSTLPPGIEEWFTNLNDNSVEGLISPKRKIWSVQFHPEGSPGPDDTAWIFDVFKDN